MNPYVSIVLPTYNRADLIGDSIRSVLGQTYQEFELIVVDDASTDNTEEVVVSFQDSRIRYLRLDENLGAAGARNRGIEAAQYDYIAFEDSDDLWLPNKLEIQMRCFDEDDYGLVYCTYYLERGNQTIMVPDFHACACNYEGWIYKELIERNFIGTPTIVMKKKCAQDVGMFCEELRSLEDWEFVLRISQRYKIKFVNQCLVHARYTVGGVNSDVEEQALSLLHILITFPMDKDVEAIKKRELLQHLCEIHDDSVLQSLKEAIVPALMSEETFEFSLFFAREKHKLSCINRVIGKCLERGVLESFIKRRVVLQGEKVAIYGYGQIGEVLTRILTELHIPFSYIVDQKWMTDDVYEFRTPDCVGEDISKLIVTVYAYNSEDIYRGMKSRPELINMYDILDWDLLGGEA